MSGDDTDELTVTIELDKDDLRDAVREVLEEQVRDARSYRVDRPLR